MTVSREQSGPPGQSASRLLRDRRLVQATWATCVALCASAVPDILAAQWKNLPPLGVGLAAMGAVLWMARAGRRNGAVALPLIQFRNRARIRLGQNSS